jgi:histidinol-phosphate aminotransferase
MENPYSLPDSLRRGWLQHICTVDLNRYPDPGAQALTRQLKDSLCLPKHSQLLLGNGSDEIIQILITALGGVDRNILSVEPSFVMYRLVSSYCHSNYIGVPLREDFSLDVDAILRECERSHPAIIFLACPNNPTGNQFSSADVETIIKAAPGLVVIDEAYAPFTDFSYLPLLDSYPNLVVMRTVSKMGLAGLRLGYLVGAAEWLNEFDKVRLPYNINSLTQLSASFLLRHKAIFDEQAEQVKHERTRLQKKLQALDGLKAYDSEANFILLRTPRGRAGGLFEALKAKGILIKNLDGTHELLKDCLRLTVGTSDQNQRLVLALKEVL